MDVTCTLPDSVNHVFVVILGESTSPCHMSLYGYSRETTPLMDARRNELSIYSDVNTPDNHTFAATQKILTFADHEHPEYFHQKPSIIGLFKAAGFETYWITNHMLLSKWGGSYGVVAQESDQLLDLSVFGKTDEVLLPALDEVLRDTVSSKNKIIFIHPMGNHHAYNCRYPDEFEYFDHLQQNDLEDLGFRDEEAKTTIDEYDNSILFGDFIFSSILDQLKSLNSTSSFLLFFSDHGEEVYDTRSARGHFISNVYPCQARIPFVLWRSEAYQEIMPDIVIDTERPHSVEHVIYSLSTLSGLKYEEYLPEKSIFTPEYTIPEKRIVGDELFDDILNKVN